MPMLDIFTPTGDATATPGGVDYRRQLAAQLAGKATDASPKGHWTHILAQALQGAASGYESTKAQADETAGRKGFTDAFAAAGPGKMPPMSTFMSPWAPSGVAGAAIGHQLGAGDRAADRALKEREVKIHEAAGTRSANAAVADCPAYRGNEEAKRHVGRLGRHGRTGCAAPGISVGPPMPGPMPTSPSSAAPAPAAPAARPSTSPWAANPTAGAAVGLMATGRLTPEAARMMIAGPAWAGVPDSTRNEAFKMVHSAHEAAATAEGMVGNIERLKELAPQAFVGANAEVRANLAAQLSSFGISHEWLLKNHSLPATQLVQQGLSQFIGTEAAKFKPMSNSDIIFVAKTLPNIGQDPVAMMNALEAMRKTALRQQLYETGRAELQSRTPYPDLAALRARFTDLAAEFGGLAGLAAAIGCSQSQAKLYVSVNWLPEGWFRCAERALAARGKTLNPDLSV